MLKTVIAKLAANWARALPAYLTGNVMKISIVLLVLLGTFLSACTTQIGGYENHERQKGGDFCPPGQAKKGNC